ncbi:MAG: branched-chain amino acid ABC transporter permease [Deltaproteobacteria bacterium]|nr:MAG: branched-chain amino acid ABC transporter permease [Deltaproteobacteria bacterium]
MSFSLLANSIASGLLMGANYALFAVGLSLVFGVLKIINLAHGELLLAGAYVGYFAIRGMGVPLPLALLFSGLSVGIVGYLYYFVVRRIRDDELNTLILTYGVGVILTNLFLLLFTADERIINIPWLTEGVWLGPVQVNRGNLVSGLVSLLIIGGLTFFLARTETGKMIRASSMDREAAALVGVDVERIDRFAFVLGCALAGFAGPLFGIVSHINPVGGEAVTINAFILTVLAGLGSIPGLLLAGIILGLGEAIIVVFASTMFQGIFALALFVAVLFLRPEGIFGRRE